jgi:Ca2+:H+ antiporter
VNPTHGLSRRELVEHAIGAVAVAVAALAHFAGWHPVVQFTVAAVALAFLARLVGHATEQLGGRLGSASAGVVQSALGNLPELFIALFALHQGLTSVVQAALIGSILANSMLVLGGAFIAGGLRHGVQTFDSPRARIIATLATLAAATLAVPTLAHTFHSPAAEHSEALSLICAGVLLVVFVLTLPGLLRDVPGTARPHETPRWSLGLTIASLGASATAAVFTADWFVDALEPAIHTLHMSEEFAGLVIVAIAGNAVENVVGIQLAAQNRPDFAIAVIVNSSLQIALALTPALVFASLFFSTSLTLVFPTLLAVALLMSAAIVTLIVYDGESTWSEGVILVGLYVVIAASFWWGT